MQNKTVSLTRGAVIAALYLLLTLLSHQMGLANGVIQLRLSEALIAFAIFTPAAVPGLTIGCLLANLLTGAPLWDILFGSLATFLGAFFSRKLKNHPVIALFPPVMSNSLIIPLVLQLAYGMEGSFWYFAATVGAGELLSCVALGSLLLSFLKRYRHFF